jgi:hypothetical protein
MTNRRDPAKSEALWRRYWAIRDDHANGLAAPISWHLALGRHAPMMVTLASTFATPGRLSDRFSQAGLCYRAWRQGYCYGAQHLAMNAFNTGDMHGYRLWLRRAANAGDTDAARELKRFETRLPHIGASRARRRRPYRKYDFEQA